MICGLLITLKDLNHVSLSKDGNYLFILINNKEICLVHFESRKVLEEYQTLDMRHFAVTTNGDYIAIAFVNKSVKVFKNHAVYNKKQ